MGNVQRKDTSSSLTRSCVPKTCFQQSVRSRSGNSCQVAKTQARANFMLLALRRGGKKRDFGERMGLYGCAERQQLQVTRFEGAVVCS